LILEFDVLAFLRLYFFRSFGGFAPNPPLDLKAQAAFLTHRLGFGERSSPGIFEDLGAKVHACQLTKTKLNHPSKPQKQSL
jgi:hypothetical protein